MSGWLFTFIGHCGYDEVPVRLSKAEIIAVITAFLEGSGGQWSWDDFISIRLDDPVLEQVRVAAADLPERFPPTEAGHYTSKEGIAELRRLLDTLRG